MFFVHPQIKLNNFWKTKLALVRRPNLEKLNKKLSVYFPEKQFIFTDMGRSAFKIIIEKLNLGNSEILLPAYICDIFYPILKDYNIKPIFLDINLKTFQIETGEIVKKITPQTKAILVCHTYGLPFDMSRFDLLRRPNLIVIEDCANSFGARQSFTSQNLGGQAQHGTIYTGNLGDISFFSLYKQFPSLRGGMLVCPKNWEIQLPKTSFNFRDFISFLNYFFPLAFLFKKFGAGIAPKVVRKEKLSKPAELNKASLSLFSNFLGDFEKTLENRKKLALFFQEELKGLGFEVQESENNVFCYLSVLVPKELENKRDEIVQKLRKYRVFCTRIWHTPIVLNKEAQEEYKINLNEFPNTAEVARRVINFPLQNHYAEKDIKKMVSATKKVINEA